MKYLGKGIYSIPYAAKLVGVNSSRIKHWINNKLHSSIISLDFEPINETFALSFLDLIEVRFIDAFRKHGVSWKTIRIASEKAKEILQDNHPFATHKFLTDRKKIFAEMISTSDSTDNRLIELVRDQYELKTIIEPYLFEGIEYSNDNIAERWWPQGKNKSVVIDPSKNFGHPIVYKEGVPTEAIAQAFKAGDTIESICLWFEIEKKSVIDAIEFEEKLAA